MARLTGNFDFSGKLGNISAYKMKGVKDTVLRTKGGAFANKVKHDPAFVNTRRNNDEFGGAATAGKAIRVAFNRVSHITGSSTGYINKFTRALANQDTVSEWGRRAVRFTETRQYLEGFNLCRFLLLNSVLRQQVVSSINRQAGTASLVIPALVAGINIKIPPEYHFYRFVVMLGVVPDFAHASNVKPYYRPVQAIMHGSTEVTTGWFSAKERVADQHFDLQLKNNSSLPDCQTLLLTLAIEFGQPVSNQLIETIPNNGAAVILATG